MKILIAVSNKEYSGPTLRVGIRVARAFKASTTIVDVGEKVSEFNAKVVGLSQERLESWNFDRPGVDVLEWAFEFLAEKKFIEPTEIEAGFPKNTLVDTGGNRSEVYLKGTICEDVNLILRNGEIISELRDEVAGHQYDVTIIGGSKKRRMAHDLIQYIDSSIFIVNQFDPDKLYKILLAVDDSKGTRKAVKYGARVAQAFNIDVDILTISKTEHFGEDYKNAAERAAKFIRRCGINYKNIYKVGDPSEVIKEVAGNNHIIVMGTSTRNPLKKFFKGSKPLKVMENCHCPILIVK
ncbi:MAG: universal stress protein [Candidatus Marinimicrobia bacterium]|jgi:nucleotide-binding universal stress UspA family protein|nr:universal stress protein [Candidatus Neomarinimicrobiota bacterium]MBT3947653.1 universal stress protein [Candidatus Neomarinimicrobiota bacterium]MBT4064729.1 universal stress protein [Candidatus Neomarinimicrobiota bacterium]MBT4452436.1 universal stress protein [Candidatus Neomarinimicrobiota bacterium]MBT4736487.1 universal stress protein [Candidatus Neomarinimicrobiota bacterium]|tara:strand:+ start:4347 stop:5231 length:885 start_codon:yes stop_codon:yes gene_type:complete